MRDASSATSDWPSLDITAVHDLQRYLNNEPLPTGDASHDSNFFLSVVLYLMIHITLSQAALAAERSFLLVASPVSLQWETF